nr:hypothetical protein [Clostridia bacterium]
MAFLIVLSFITSVLMLYMFFFKGLEEGLYFGLFMLLGTIILFYNGYFRKHIKDRKPGKRK